MSGSDLTALTNLIAVQLGGLFLFRFDRGKAKEICKVKAVINAEWLATEISSLIYRNGKAKMFNVLESQMETTESLGAMGDSPKLRATKRITEDLLETISKQAAQLIRDTLGDWEEDIAISEKDVLSPEEMEKVKLLMQQPGEMKFFDPNDVEIGLGAITRLNDDFRDLLKRDDDKPELLMYPTEKSAVMASNNKLPAETDKLAVGLCESVTRSFKQFIK